MCNWSPSIPRCSQSLNHGERCWKSTGDETGAEIVKYAEAVPCWKKMEEFMCRSTCQQHRLSPAVRPRQSFLYLYIHYSFHCVVQWRWSFNVISLLSCSSPDADQCFNTSTRPRYDHILIQRGSVWIPGTRVSATNSQSEMKNCPVWSPQRSWRKKLESVSVVTRWITSQPVRGLRGERDSLGPSHGLRRLKAADGSDLVWCISLLATSSSITWDRFLTSLSIVQRFTLFIITEAFLAQSSEWRNALSWPQVPQGLQVAEVTDKQLTNQRKVWMSECRNTASADVSIRREEPLNGLMSMEMMTVGLSHRHQTPTRERPLDTWCSSLQQSSRHL